MAGTPPVTVTRSREGEKLKAMLPEKANEHRGLLEDAFWALLNSQEFMFNH